MRLYLDSANMDDWQKCAPSGLVFGVTTNPLLAKRAGLSYSDINWSEMVKLAAQLGWHEIHIQLTENDLASDSKASQLYALGEAFDIDVVLKIPMNDRFIRALPTIRQKGKKILMTACYEAKQMFVAQALRAEYIAPYFGRMVEAGLDAHNELKTMKAIGDSCDTPCRILIASVRSVEQMCQLAREGHDCFTLNPDLITGLVTSSLSDKAIAEFEQAAKK